MSVVDGQAPEAAPEAEIAVTVRDLIHGFIEDPETRTPEEILDEIFETADPAVIYDYARIPFLMEVKRVIRERERQARKMVRQSVTSNGKRALSADEMRVARWLRESVFVRGVPKAIEDCAIEDCMFKICEAQDAKEAADHREKWWKASQAAMQKHGVTRIGDLPTGVKVQLAARYA